MRRPDFEFRGGRQNGKPRKKEFTFRAPPPTSSRPLLRGMRESTPEFIHGTEDDEEKRRKFLSMDDVTDSEETEMEVSSAEGESTVPPRKKQDVEPASNAEPERAKWSNPDPYTALPPLDESQGKRKDFVKMIRKARVDSAPTKSEQNNAVVSNDDFISLGDLGQDEPPADAPRGPKGLRNQDNDPALGSRKRTRDDEIVGRAGKPDSRFSTDGSVMHDWRPLKGQDQAPWLDQSNPPTLHLATMLHNEILSFYHWVRPKPFENIVREDLISRLQTLCLNRYFGCQLHAFGSFASGLYLPIADIDLVLLSRQFIRQGKKTLAHGPRGPRDVYAFTRYLKDSDIAEPGSIQPIAHARVPIIKFKDKLTGLRVDLSFDNTSGLEANKTFQLWQSQFPAMPVIVSVIKQFLLLRGLNEVPTGGLGGFSIICLVTSLLQHLPRGSTEPNLGSVLMDFLNFYGNEFDPRSVGIQLEPPGYFNKTSRDVYQADRNTRLAITDPNDSDNDISGGTKEILRILQCFAKAYKTLKESLVSTAFHPSQGTTSLLGSVIGANYDSYKSQREKLHHVFMTDPRFASFWAPPPPPPPPVAEPPAPSPPPPPPPPPAEEAKAAADTKQSGAPAIDTSQLSKKQVSSFARANRLRALRPDIEHVPALVTVDKAIGIGGYTNISEMDRDLNTLEKAQKAQ